MNISRNESLLKFKEFLRIRVYKYFISLFILSVAAVFQHLLWPFIEPAPFILFYPAIILAALYGDGTSAIIGSVLIAQYFFIEPKQSFQMTWPNDYLRQVLFILSAVLIRKVTRELTKAKLQADSTVVDLKEERLSREKFVSTLTHDLRTPITVAKLNAQMLKRQTNDPVSLSKASEKIIESCNRADQLIQDLLDVSRIKAGQKLTLELTECDLSKTIEKTLEELSTIYGKRFVYKKESDVKGMWNCDGMRRVIENLCSNAVKYGSDTPVNISLSSNEKKIVIAIQNLGPVIPEEEIQHLFEPFKRIEENNHSGVQGWGLGLALVKGIIEAHGGRIEVKSHVTTGTVFRIELPER